MPSLLKTTYRKIKSLQAISKAFSPEEIEELLIEARVPKMAERQTPIKPAEIGFEEDFPRAPSNAVIRVVPKALRVSTQDSSSIHSQRASIEDVDSDSTKSQGSSGSEGSRSRVFFRRLKKAVTKPSREFQAADKPLPELPSQPITAWAKVGPWKQDFDADKVAQISWADETQAVLEETAEEISISHFPALQSHPPHRNMQAVTPRKETAEEVTASGFRSFDPETGFLRSRRPAIPSNASAADVTASLQFPTLKSDPPPRIPARNPARNLPGPRPQP
ncbi:hypothetical protein WAI453_008331 [Rhynchosporium graminicola]